ncbi:aminoglycoside phosphotransferase family protein [Paenibacillus urinalis]|uniref:aminoglycoside phosphotransferase family protein n=1 Tax=Paenibacillus urinalis TaxID=521520 RepID=UPI002367CA6C|nr:aminoglycoside phosphotransferase family protein [Paenibacillus urinalis]WDH96892.1 aminoglycoside phosphotransferase family protein [Paenibacillus urinalis]
MIDAKDFAQIQELCTRLKLGIVARTPEQVTGGLLHKMYSIVTDRGTYAIKMFNTEIMQRPAALQNYKDAERISRMAAMNQISALPAISVDDESIHLVGSNIYLVFDWIEGGSLSLDQIRPTHCEIVGDLLARIHAVDFAVIGVADHNSQDVNSQDVSIINWNYYLENGKAASAVWAKLLEENLDLMYEWNARAVAAVKVLSAMDRVISHRDLDPKNIMWHDDVPIIIDWEAAGYINQWQDMTETLLYWSVDANGRIIPEKFTAFMRGYKKQPASMEIDWRPVLYNGMVGKLDWLEYNLKRSLCMGCRDAQEQHLGEKQVILTLAENPTLYRINPYREKWLQYDFNT